ncbi:MAG: undecaprenyldiphospho-muramoylpentapeptide beta-N-acetylglucosaminyltransferase [Oscillospiraceae bacterium]|nr:undecaprenyldiphospho-muramoylpentapeptide beta-N-acetylglucosaminyltransferase [Oscillospiraceae bacterium]
MNVIFTCGGTGGHIYPALAIADIWKERHRDSQILFIGGRGNMEEQLVPKAGYELITLPAFGLERGKSFQDLKNNFRAIKSTLSGVRKCKKIIRDFKPDVIVGTGGYASFPALMAGAKLGIPTCVHESNAMPGLTTRLLAKKVDKVLVCFPESKKYYKCPEKVQVVGMPVKREFIYTKKEDARKELGIDERPLIVSAFGSQGAKAMNQVMAEVFALEQAAGFPYRHIHAVGSFGWSWMPEYVREKGVDLGKSPAITMQEYIYNMPTVMAAADIIISRAGASSCNEIAASGTPCILIPSPNVTDNHQEKNARALADQGGAILIKEEECTAELLMQQISSLLADKKRYQQMIKSLQSMVVVDCTEKLCDLMEELGKGAANGNEREN